MIDQRRSHPFPTGGVRGGRTKIHKQMGIWFKFAVIFGSRGAYYCYGYRYSHLLLHSEGSSNVKTLLNVSQSSPGAGRQNLDPGFGAPFLSSVTLLGLDS